MGQGKTAHCSSATVLARPPIASHLTNQTQSILATRRTNPSIDQSINRSIESFRCSWGRAEGKNGVSFLIERFAPPFENRCCRRRRETTSSACVCPLFAPLPKDRVKSCPLLPLGMTTYAGRVIPPLIDRLNASIERPPRSKICGRDGPKNGRPS